MNAVRLTGILTLTVSLVMGCSGNNANIKNLSESESKAIQQDLLDNWSDYHISYNRNVIVFDPKNDDKKILIYNSIWWGTVNDQKTWTQIVNGTKTVPDRINLNQVWGEPIREIWVHNQFYGYVSHYRRDIVSAEIVDENSVQLIHTYSADWRQRN
jgi:hypothetical protein